jgi:hypothetical protein
MNPDANEDFIPTSTWEDLLISRGYSSEVIEGMKQRRREKEERLLSEFVD